MVDLSVIVASYNTRQLTCECIESIFKTTTNITFEVLVVDDCSKDGSPEAVEQMYPAVRVIRNKHNLRYAKTNNAGLLAAKGRYALLLNSDTIIHEGAFEALVRFMDETPQAAAAGPRLLNPDGTVQHCIRGFPGLLPMIAQSVGLQRLLPNNSLTNQYYHENFDYERAAVVDSIGTTAFIIRRRTWEEYGLLDERFTLAMVDLAYCLMLKQAGQQVYYFPGAQVTHYGSASINQGGAKEIRMLHEAVRKFYDIYLAKEDNLLVRFLVRLGIVLRLRFKLLEHQLSSDKRVIKGPGAPKAPVVTINEESRKSVPQGLYSSRDAA